MALPRRTLARLVLAATSALAALLALEFIVRWRIEGGAMPALASFVGARASGEVHAADSWYVPDPVLGYRLNPALEGIDARGIRSGPIAVPKPRGVTRVIVLGDSVAYGDGAFPDLLRAHFAERTGGACELINASIPGYTTYQERALLESELLALEPDLVLLQYCLNDHHRFLHQIAPDGRRLLTPEARRALVPEGDGVFARLERWSYLAVELRRRFFSGRASSAGLFPWESREDFCTAWRESSWPTFEEHVRAMRDELRARGARFAIVAMPIEDQFDPARLAADREYVLFPQRHLARVAAATGVPLLDLFDTFQSARASGAKLFTDGLHLTPEGHALAAREIEAFAEPEQLLDDSR